MDDAELVMGKVGFGQERLRRVANGCGVMAYPVAPCGQEMRRQILFIDDMIQGRLIDEGVAALPERPPQGLGPGPPMRCFGCEREDPVVEQRPPTQPRGRRLVEDRAITLADHVVE